MPLMDSVEVDYSHASVDALIRDNVFLRAENDELQRECTFLRAELRSVRQDEDAADDTDAPSGDPPPAGHYSKDVRSLLTVLEQVLQEKRDAEIHHRAAVAQLRDEIDAKIEENTRLLETMDSVVTAMEKLQSERES